MYSFESRIRYSEVGTDGRLSLESLLDYYQDCSTFHSEDIGLGLEYLKEKHMAWVLSSWQIVVERYPRLGENIIISTAPYEFKGFIGYRNFWMETESGERVSCANSVWSLMDLDKMAPAKPPREMLTGYKLSERLPMDYAPRKIMMPEGGVEQEKIQIRIHHLDTNGHVNNGQYVRIAAEYIPKNFQIRQMRAEYKKPAVLDDNICACVASSEDQTLYTISLNGEDGRPYSVIEFMGMDSK